LKKAEDLQNNKKAKGGRVTVKPSEHMETETVNIIVDSERRQ